MQPSYTHLTNDELVRHCQSDPGDLLREGELIRRITNGEVHLADNDELEDLRSQVQMKEEEVETLEKEAADLRDQITALEATIDKARTVLDEEPELATA